MEAIAKAIEHIINHYLALDPFSVEKLPALSNKVVEINVTDWHLSFFLVFQDKHIQVLSHYEATPDAIIRSPSWKFFKSDLIIEGDSQLAYEVHRLLKSVDIDWEEQLSKYIGDIPAHSIVTATQHLYSFIKKNVENMRLNLIEYFQFEKELSPSKKALDEFADDVMKLEMDVERLEAKVKRLRNV